MPVDEGKLPKQVLYYLFWKVCSEGHEEKQGLMVGQLSVAVKDFFFFFLHISFHHNLDVFLIF